MTNPYESTAVDPEPEPTATGFQRVDIQPMDRLYKAKELMGEQYWLFVGVVFVGWLISSVVPFGILTGAMLCGLFICYRQRVCGRQTRFEHLFKGFDFFVESLVAMLIFVVASLVVMIPFFVVGFGLLFGAASFADGEGDIGVVFIVVAAVFYIVMLAAMLLVTIPIVFVMPLIVDRKMKAMEAIKLSYRAALAHVGGLFGMTLLYMLIGTLSAFACYFPYFLFAPLAMGSIVLIYHDIFGITSDPLPESPATTPPPSQ